MSLCYNILAMPDFIKIIIYLIIVFAAFFIGFTFNVIMPMFIPTLLFLIPFTIFVIILFAIHNLKSKLR